MKLTLELVPASCFYKNVRQILTKTQWNILSRQVRSQAYDICEICHSNSEKSLDCHEIWEYNDTRLIQKLIKMIALCKNCHQVKHFGLARLQGREAYALQHFMKINKMQRKEAENYIQKAFMTWADRSQYNWSIDISILSNYSLKLTKEKLVNNANK